MYDILPVGGYLSGTGSDSNADVSFVRIPAGGTYTFETSAQGGACNFALEENTILQLYDAGYNLLAENDDIDVANLNYCSRITRTMAAGSYYVVVWGSSSTSRNYNVMARPGT